MAYLGCRHLSVCLVSLFAGAKDWTSDAGNQKRRPLFCFNFPNIMFLTHVLSNVKINFEEVLGTLWKSVIFDPLWAEINRFLSTLWENLRVFKTVHICHQEPERLQQVSSLLLSDLCLNCCKCSCTVEQKQVLSTIVANVVVQAQAQGLRE